MALPDFLKKLKQKAEERLNPKQLTPEEERAQKQAAARKQFEQVNRVINLGKKAVQVHGDVKKKAETIKDGIAETTIRVVDKISGQKGDATPAEPKQPGIIGKTVSKGVQAVKDAGETIGDKARTLSEQQRAAAARKPTTKSSLLDAIVPAVPETKATAPKKPAGDTPAKPKRQRKPKNNP